MRKLLLPILLLGAFVHLSRGEEIDDGPKKSIEFPSPDRRFAFRETGSVETQDQAYQLIRKDSGKVLAQVAAEDPGGSARFDLEVLWRPDSKAFALTGTLWRRGSYVAVFVWDGATFHEVKLPILEAAIPEKLKGGKPYGRVIEMNSRSAKRWLKDGSLVVEVENIEEDGGTEIASDITANRTVVLAFGKAGRAKVVKSTIKFTKD